MFCSLQSAPQFYIICQDISLSIYTVYNYIELIKTFDSWTSTWVLLETSSLC